jgi:HAD superfamily hydrolase (TIGR01549 family)
MGADHLVPRFAPGRDEPFEEWWHTEFEPFIGELSATTGAGDLVRSLGDRGVVNVYATSGSPQDVGRLRSIIAADDSIAAAVNSSEVEASKPDPDIFEAAMQRVGADRARTMVVGDSVWDVRAAAACGIGCVGVTCGGTSAAELVAAGALAVYEHPRDVLEQLASSPIAVLLG